MKLGWASSYEHTSLGQESLKFHEQANSVHMRQGLAWQGQNH